jgi:hypothetical protein
VDNFSSRRFAGRIYRPSGVSLNGNPAMAARVTGHPWTLEELLDSL